MAQFLDTAQSAMDYRVIGFTSDARTSSKLETLGLVPGSMLHVISNTGAGLIIKVKESRLAIGHDMAKHLSVAEGNQPSQPNQQNTQDTQNTQDARH